MSLVYTIILSLSGKIRVWNKGKPVEIWPPELKKAIKKASKALRKVEKHLPIGWDIKLKKGISPNLWYVIHIREHEFKCKGEN